MTEDKCIIRVKVFRFDPEKDAQPYYKTYLVPIVPGETTVLKVLKYIYEKLDQSLSFYATCDLPYWEAKKKGICGQARCNVFVNGKPVLTCEEKVYGDITIDPPTQIGFNVIKDLVTDAIKITEDEFNKVGTLRLYKNFEKLGELIREIYE
jgi:succinate dehydrogenase/fumarate reductase-like Fe-S protein